MMATTAKYVRLSSEDDDLRQGGKLESNSIANQRDLLDAFISRMPELAGTNIIDTLKITECRDLNPLPAGRLKDRAALGGLYISSIYCNLHLLPPICPPLRQAFRIQIHHTVSICRIPAGSPHRSSDTLHAQNHASLYKPDAPGY